MVEVIKQAEEDQWRRRHEDFDVSHLLALPPKELSKRLRDHVIGRGGPTMNSSGEVALPNGAWMLMLASASLIECQAAALAHIESLNTPAADVAGLLAYLREAVKGAFEVGAHEDAAELDKARTLIETLTRLSASRASAVTGDRAELVKHGQGLILHGAIAQRWRDDVIAMLEADARSQPIPMLLFCPVCNLQHIDKAAPADSPEPHWDNPPHRSHLCLGCGHVWRPCDQATTGVAGIQTTGKADGSPIPVPPASMASAVREITLLANFYHGERSAGLYEALAILTKTGTPESAEPVCKDSLRTAAESAEPAVPQEVDTLLIRQIVERFLAWPLPENFNPDGGISYSPTFNTGSPREGKNRPCGTNLLDYFQATAMVQHILEGVDLLEKVDEWDVPLTDAENAKIEESWQRFKAVKPDPWVKRALDAEAQLSALTKGVEAVRLGIETSIEGASGQHRDPTRHHRIDAYRNALRILDRRLPAALAGQPAAQPAERDGRVDGGR